MGVFLLGIAEDSLPLVPLMLGIVWTFRYQSSPDFSLAGSFSLGGALTAAAFLAGISPLLSVVLGITSGLLVGFTTGFLCNFMKIEPLLAGVLVLFMSYSCSLAVTQGTIRVPSASNLYEQLRLSSGAGVAVLLLGIFVASLLLLNHLILGSEWGCAFRALEGTNSGRTFLTSLAIPPRNLSCIGFSVGGSLAALSGIVVALRDGQATSSLGTETFIDAVPAYLLGSLLFERRVSIVQKRSPSVALLKAFRIASPSLAASLGIVLFFAFVSISLHWVPFSWLPKLVLGAVIATTLGLPSLISTQRSQAEMRTQTQSTGTLGDLAVSGLSVSYPTLEGSATIIDNGSFRIPRGSIVHIAGNNGSGKTTLLKALCGRIVCQGRFEVPTLPSQRAGASRESLLLYVPQDPSEDLVDCLNLAEHVSLCSLRSQPSLFRHWRAGIRTSMGVIPLRDSEQLGSAFPRMFSGGERRRILLGLLRVRGEALPRVICLDEPFSYLDAQGVEYCLNLLNELAAKDYIVLFTDHGSVLKPTPRVLYTWGAVKGGEPIVDEDESPELRHQDVV